MSASLQTESPWSLRVDADGQPDRDGAFLARPPVPYHGGSTISRKGIDDVTARRETVQNRKLLDRAVFIASQTPNARALLKFAYRSGIEVKFDSDSTREEKSAAVAKIDSKTGRTSHLLLNPFTPDGEDPALCRACTLAHEFTHAVRNTAKFIQSETDTLPSAIKMVRAQEADAHLAGILAIAEFSAPQPGTPANRWVPPALARAFDNETAPLRKAIEKGLPHLQNGDTAQFARGVFAAFYNGSQNLAFYDESTIKTFTTMGSVTRKGGVPRFRSEFMQTNYADHDRIVKTMTLGGKPYLADAPFSLDAPEFTSLVNTPKVVAAYQDLVTEIGFHRDDGYRPQVYLPFRAPEPETLRAPVQDLRSLLPGAGAVRQPRPAVLPA